MTILVPDRFVSSGANLISYVLNNCGAPITVDLFLPSIFTVNSGNYTYNAAAAALAGVSLKPGLTTPPELSHIVTVTPAGGIFLENSSNNIFQSVSITNNTIGAYMDADSNGNTFLENTFSSNSTYDISTVSTGNNQLDQSTFDLSKIDIVGTGLIQVYFKARALVQNGATPIENASVTFTDALNNIVGPLLTDASGLTAYTTSMLAIVLDQSNPHVATAGGLNPFTAEATTINGVSYITENLISRDQQFTIGAGSKRRSLTEECVDCSDDETETPAPTSGSGSPTTTTPNPTQPTHPSAPNTVVKPTFSGYTDLPENDLDYAAFKYAYEQGIVTGNPDGSARPEDFLQRDQAAKMIATFSPDYSTKTDYCDGKKPFRDILSTFWGAQEICFGKQIGAITGYTEDRTYLPTNWMNRAEFLALILRSMPNLELPTSGTDSYRDVLPRKWYSLFAKFAFDQSLFAITSEQKLFPDNFITRREATLIIYALREYR
jgi:parallel beta-helix repeat protein